MIRDRDQPLTTEIRKSITDSNLNFYDDSRTIDKAVSTSVTNLPAVSSPVTSSTVEGTPLSAPAGGNTTDADDIEILINNIQQRDREAARAAEDRD